MNRRRISIALMILTIGTIAVFQSLWLNKNYKEEKKLVALRMNLLFKESVYKLQASKLHLDTSGELHVQARAGVIGMTNVLKEKVAVVKRDSFFEDNAVRGRPRKNYYIAFNTSPDEEKEDSTLRPKYRKTDLRIFNFLERVDSLQEPITAKEVTARFKREMAKEKIDLPFTITTQSATKFDLFPPDIDENKVVVGFSKPVIYQLNPGNMFWYVIGKLGSQIFFSFLLVGVTIFSFTLLYRNWQRQRRLAELKNDFISNITHELKTPIATVSVAIEALRNFNALQDPKRTNEYLSISEYELQRLTLLVDKVLKLSMFEKREIDLKKTSFDLEELTEEVLGAMRPQFEKRGAMVKFTAEGVSQDKPREGQFTIQADKVHITSVLYNLLDNALKYTKEHPVIDVRLSNPRENILEWQIADNGIGIAKEYRQKIFDKFFRVPTGDRHNTKGYGLGLSYVSEIVKRHMGYIQVDSEPGRGSIFTVKIPAQEADVIIFDEHRRAFKKHFGIGGFTR